MSWYLSGNWTGLRTEEIPEAMADIENAIAELEDIVNATTTATKSAADFRGYTFDGSGGDSFVQWVADQRDRFFPMSTTGVPRDRWITDENGNPLPFPSWPATFIPAYSDWVNMTAAPRADQALEALLQLQAVMEACVYVRWDGDVTWSQKSGQTVTEYKVVTIPWVGGGFGAQTNSGIGVVNDCFSWAQDGSQPADVPWPIAGVPQMTAVYSSQSASPPDYFYQWEYDEPSVSEREYTVRTLAGVTMSCSTSNAIGAPVLLRFTLRGGGVPSGAPGSLGARCFHPLTVKLGNAWLVLPSDGVGTVIGVEVDGSVLDDFSTAVDKELVFDWTMPGSPNFNLMWESGTTYNTPLASGFSVNVLTERCVTDVSASLTYV